MSLKGRKTNEQTNMQMKYNNASYISDPANQLQNELLWTVRDHNDLQMTRLETPFN